MTDSDGVSSCECGHPLVCHDFARDIASPRERANLGRCEGFFGEPCSCRRYRSNRAGEPVGTHVSGPLNSTRFTDCHGLAVTKIGEPCPKCGRRTSS